MVSTGIESSCLFAELKSLKLPNLPYLLIVSTSPRHKQRQAAAHSSPLTTLQMATHDVALPLQIAEGMKSHVTEGTLTRDTIEGAGHWPVLEQPDPVALIIRQWIAKSVGLGTAAQSRE